MGVFFSGKIRAIGLDQGLYFDVVDEESGMSFNRFMKLVCERWPGLHVKIYIRPSDKLCEDDLYFCEE